MKILIVMLLFAVSAIAQEKTPAPPQTPAQGPPPRNLTKLPDGHFSANSDPKDVENYEVHVVVAGDTLSGISKDVLKDGKLWPQIWEQNEHVVNPHWIYPNDKILIRAVTKISEAKPPEPEAPAAIAEVQEPAPPAAPQPLKGKLVPAPYRSTVAESSVPRTVLDMNPPRVFPEVKQADLNCSGFIRTQDVPGDLKVTGRYSDDQDLASAGDYVYVGKGAESGIRPGVTYQILRPTRQVNGVSGTGKGSVLGTHYLEVGQAEVVLGQADYAVARVKQGCEAVEVGDLLVPYVKTDFPALSSKRAFSGTMRGSGQVPGNVILTKDAVLNSSSTFGTKYDVPSAGRGSTLHTLDRGVAGEGGIVYLDIGKETGAKPGDLFIVFRDSPGNTSARTAIAEVVILKVEERASTALVTYSDDAISLGDVVERR
jgi:hypothetical protein